MDLMSKIISLCKRRGFIFPSSEIYGGVEAIYDFGPLGVELKNNLKKIWWRRFVQERVDIVGMDGSVIMHPKVWQASGHAQGFIDTLSECKGCHTRFRADDLADGCFVGVGKARESNQCPECGGKDFTKPRQFNIMFKTFLGPIEDEADQTFLRPETAQSMFTNFKNILDSSRKKPPFGIAQVGKSFRNEITTGNFIFRLREFEIAEIEYFTKPGDDEKWFEKWLGVWERFFIDLGVKKKNLRRVEHPKNKLAHYSKRTVDIEYKFPFGWGELAGVANRTDYDLKRHMKFSGKDLSYFDEARKLSYVPYVIEPTMGIERTLLAILLDAYEEVKGGRTKTTKSSKETEVVLRLHKLLAPIKVAVLPLVKNKPKLVKVAQKVYDLVAPCFMSEYDEVGSIGRRYRRQDEIGTPFCLTIDFDTLKDKAVTVRDRDTMRQERVPIDKLVGVLKKKFEN